jgi:hypothetical protein
MVFGVTLPKPSGARSNPPSILQDARAAGHQRGALFDAHADQPLDLVELLLADDRPKIDALGIRGTDDQPSAASFAYANASRGVRAARTCAWAHRTTGRCCRNTHGRRASRLLQIGIFENQVGRFAAQFLMTRLTVSAAAFATCTPARVEPVNDIMSMSG